MKLRIPLVEALVGLAVASGLGLAATTAQLEVLQPIDGGDTSPKARFVTYVDYFNGLDPGHVVERTCSSNCVITPQGAQDMNVASQAGFKITVVHRKGDWRSARDALFGDTLRVILDVRSIDTVTVVRRYHMDADFYVAPTIQCVLLNAARGSREVGHIDLRILGPPETRKHAGVFQAKDYWTWSTAGRQGHSW